LRRYAAVLVVVAAAFYDAANPAFGEQRVQRLQQREAAAEDKRQAARAIAIGRSEEMSRAAREELRAGAAALAQRNKTPPVPD
tara:strand:- start:240 stop:488 length:249 start_codon:yes stop_codon:yes gene_type:complete